MSQAGGIKSCIGRSIPCRVIGVSDVGVCIANDYGLFGDICRVRACPNGVEASTSCILKPKSGIYNYFLVEVVGKAWLTRNNQPRCSQRLDQPRRWSRRKLDGHHLLDPLHSTDEWNHCRDRRSPSPQTLSSRRIRESVFLRQGLYDRTRILQCLSLC